MASGDRIIQKLNHIISIFEKKRFDLVTLFIWIFFLSAFRMWTEAYLLDYPYKEFGYGTLFNQIHITAFFMTAFVGGVVIIKYFTKEKVVKVANLAAIGFIMVVIPPFIDVLRSANPEPYSYVSLFEIFSSASDFLGSGVLIELLAIGIATSLYVFVKRYKQKKMKAVFTAILNFITFTAFFIFLGSPLLSDFNRNAGNLIHPLMLIRYMIISAIFIILLLYMTNKKLLKSFIQSSRLLTSAHFALMTFIGIMISGHIFTIRSFEFNLFSLFSDPTMLQIFSGNIGMFILSIITIVFVWQTTIMINHIYDANIDRIDNKERLIPAKLLKVSQVKKIAIIYGIISLGLGILIGVWTFALVVIGLFFGIIYSIPPIRLRDSVFSTTIIGIGSTIAFFIGYVTPSYVKVFRGEAIGDVLRIYPEITNESLFIGLLIFVALSIGPIIKDYKDYEGDKKAGIKNLFTIYGIEKGVKITSVLLIIPFLCLILLFNGIIDIIILLIAGILASTLFYKSRNTKLVFAIYFPIILYCLLRWFELIQFT